MTSKKDIAHSIAAFLDERFEALLKFLSQHERQEFVFGIALSAANFSDDDAGHAAAMTWLEDCAHECLRVVPAGEPCRREDALAWAEATAARFKDFRTLVRRGMEATRPADNPRKKLN